MNISIKASDVSEERRKHMSSFNNVTVTCSNTQVTNDSDIVFIAVKPQNIDNVLEQIRDTEKLIVSIAAGVSLRRLETNLKKARLIRVMPNTPCLVGEMAGGFSLGVRAKKEDGDMLKKLLKKSGYIFQLDEELLDVVTALSGSGPAFISYIIKAMADGATKQGLPKNVAKKLAIQTVLGTGKLLRDMDFSPEDLIEMVSSPSGTTIAGRQVLENSDVKDILEKTIAVATERGREIGRSKN